VDPVPDLGIVFNEVAGGNELLGFLNHLIHALGTQDKAVIEWKSDREDGKQEQEVDGKLFPVPPGLSLIGVLPPFHQ
jgi:hypothetical protein